MALSKEELVRELARLVDIVIADDEVSEVGGSFPKPRARIGWLNPARSGRYSASGHFPRWGRA